MSEFVQVCSIHPSKINIFYERIPDGIRKTYSRFENETTPVDSSKISFLNSTRKSNGQLSVNAKRKMSRAIEYLVTLAKPKKVHEKLTGKTINFKLAFITLTLPSPQIHKDSEIINKCLNQFLIECRKYHLVKNYVWRAEKQKNGNIHFHILIDQFIPWYMMRNSWNRIVNKLGYVDRFQEKHGHTTPNSTDIHSTKKIKNIRLYLLKYMTKSEQNTEQSGRIWSCNQELSNIKGCQLYIDREVHEELQKIITHSKPHIFESQYFSVYSISINQVFKYSREILFKYFSDYLIQTFNYNAQLNLEI